MEKFYADVVIIGAGLAGVYTALELDSNFRIIIISKELISENNSSLAQGGIAACTKKDDSFILHVRDTLKAGSRVNDVKAVDVLVNNGALAVAEMIKLGVNFDKDENGSIKTTMEGGHSRRRILHAGGDATGKEIMEVLVCELRRRDNIVLWENTMAIDLIKNNERCIGVEVLKDNQVISVLSKNTVISTGGIGEVYKNTTNSCIATGDGIAMAYRAGCKVANMEFIQFHPTAFYSNGNDRKFLISEAVRGEGAVLRNKYNERFMQKYHSDIELAPRDIVSQSIYKEMQETDSDYVYLDITHKERAFLKQRFPTIFNKCLEHGIDISKDYIPVTPVEHYSIGGIKVNLYGQTNVTNLYACGECTNTGVHGANRLASNSLLECAVFGGKIADDINSKKDESSLTILEDIKITDVSLNIADKIIEQYRQSIKETMEKYVGIVRCDSGLKLARKAIDTILEGLKLNRVQCKEYYEVLNMATVSKLIIEACLLRKESIGCHFILDEGESLNEKAISRKYN